MGFVQELDQVEQLRNRIADLEAQLQDKEQQLNQEKQNGHRKFQALTENLPIVLYTLDTEGIVTMSEGKGLSAIGSKPGQSVGKNIFEMYKDLPETGNYIRRALAGEEIQAPMKVGPVHMQTWYSPLRDEKGAITGMLGLAIDITELKQAETQMQESRNLLQTVLDAIPVRVFWKDTHFNYLGCNQLFAQDAKLKSYKDLVGKSDFDFYPDDADAFRADDLKVMESGISRLNFEEQQTTPDGKQMWLRTSKIPLRNVAGETIGVLGTFDDITQRKQAEMQMQESRNLLQTVLDAIPVRVFWKDTHFNYLGCNQLFAQDAKIKSSNDLIGKSDDELFPNDAEAYRADDQKVIVSGKSKLNFEEPQAKPDGSTMWLRTSKIPLRNVAGEVVGILGTYDDVTERKQAEIELSESKDRLELAFNAANLASWDWNMLTNFTTYDDGFNRMLGYEPGTLGNDLSGFVDNLHPDDIERTFKAVNAYVEGRAPKYDTEFRMKHKDGSWHWVAATGLVVERQADGKAVRMIGVNQDITARKQADLELRESKDRLELALDIAQLGRWDADLITNKTLFDDRYEKMLGFLPGELAGENPSRVSNIHPDDMVQMFEKVMNYATGKTAEYEAEFRTETRDGNWKWIYAKAQIVERLPDGTPLRLAGVNQDITARKQADQEREQLLTNEREARREAQEALRMKDLFLATMSHELRTPLNAMIGFQHLMLFSQQLDADNSHMAERSIANSQRLLNLINNILDISRIATGGLKIVLVNMSPRSLANGIGTDLNLQAKEKGLNLKVEVADDVPEQILHDEERMGQIMLNLVGNALKFTEPNGTVTLRVRSANERLVIEVQDTGIGIPASQKHVIFDDFVQLDNSSTRKHQGAGLGLAIVKRLALLMQGSITVESEIGQGSTFVVTLPLNLKPEMYQ